MNITLSDISRAQRNILRHAVSLENQNLAATKAEYYAQELGVGTQSIRDNFRGLHIAGMITQPPAPGGRIKFALYKPTSRAMRLIAQETGGDNGD